jgi:tRNA pseudouridine55 synthase
VRLDLLHLVDKPEGWTSHDVVARLRGVLGERRIGHAGTLDPFATGLLLVAEGRATGLLGCMSLLPKRYRAVARLGVATDTQDRTGVPIKTSAEIPSAREVLDAVERLKSLTRQRPPSYSAVKVRGERLYQAARRGESPLAEERSIRIYELHADASELPDVALDVTVSRGTYVRTLAHDLGEALGCGAHLISLRRVATGPFAVEGAFSPRSESGVTASDLRARATAPAAAVSHLPRVTLTDEESSRLRHGRPPAVALGRVELAPLSFVPPPEERWPLACFSPEGDLIALAEAPGADAPLGVVPPLKLFRVFP